MNPNSGPKKRFSDAQIAEAIANHLKEHGESTIDNLYSEELVVAKSFDLEKKKIFWSRKKHIHRLR